jgi:hypothetical protein
MPSEAERELAAILQRNPDLRFDDDTAGEVMDDVSRRVNGSPRVQREEQMQRDLFTWIRGQEGYAPALMWVCHYPSGGKRHPAVAAKMWALGTRAGVPDILLPIRIGKWVGLALELKCGKNKTTPEQGKWLEHLRINGWQTAVVYDDWRLAANEIARYLGYDELVQEIADE